MKNLFMWALIVMSVVFLSGCRPPVAPETPAPEAPDAAAPAPAPAASRDFDIPSLSVDGGTIALASHKGKVVLLDFWATWCPPCRYELPALMKLYADLKDRDFVLIGMTVDQGSLEKVQADVAKFSLTYPVGLAGPDVQAAYGGIRAVPTKFLLGKDGSIIETFIGLVPEEELRSKIEGALAE